MSDRAPRPTLTGTGAHKRANEDRMLRQVYQSLRELHTRLGHLLDMVGAILFEREEREADQASEAPAATPSDPHQRATVFQRRPTAIDFIDAIQSRWDEARTEADRDNVLAILQRGRDQGLINDEELTATRERLQGR